MGKKHASQYANFGWLQLCSVLMYYIYSYFYAVYYLMLDMFLKYSYHLFSKLSFRF